VHGAGSVVLPGHSDPAGHMICTVVFGQNEPLAHGFGNVVFGGQKYPLSQSVSLIDDSGQEVPARHMTWVAGVLQTEPPLQALRTVAPAGQWSPDSHGMLTDAFGQ